jgi:hypothetical protein
MPAAAQDEAGRPDYISNPKWQENILAASPQVDWKPYRDFERAHRKTYAPNNEGREVMIALPNGVNYKIGTAHTQTRE